MDVTEVEKHLNRELLQNNNWMDVNRASGNKQMTLLHSLALAVGGERIVETFMGQKAPSDPDAFRSDNKYFNGELTVFVYTSSRLLLAVDPKPLDRDRRQSALSVSRSSLRSFSVNGVVGAFSNSLTSPEHYSVTVEYSVLDRPYEIGRVGGDESRIEGYGDEVYRAKLDRILSLLIKDESSIVKHDADA